MKKNVFNNQKHSVLKEMPISFRFRFLAFLSLFLFYHGPMANAQNCFTGTLWVTPKHSSAFPATNATSWNPGLNIVFEEYGVTEYVFLDSIYTACILSKKPVYEIRMDENHAHLEFELREVLFYCFRPLFEWLEQPYIFDRYGNPMGFDCHGSIFLLYFSGLLDPSVLPASYISSNNDDLNLILESYDIYSYTYDPFIWASGDTGWHEIEIVCASNDLLNLYYDLLPLNLLIDEIYVNTACLLPDIDYNCGTYSKIEDPVIDPISISPNPVQDHATISGVAIESACLYDGYGKKVFLPIIDLNRIDLSHFPQGFYLLQIVSKTGDVYIKKIIKK